MNYEDALRYLQCIDTVVYQDQLFEEAVNKAINALRDCLELGLTGEDHGIRWEKAGELHVQHDPKLARRIDAAEIFHEDR